MVSTFPSGGMWPTASDLDLLRAAIKPGVATDPVWDRVRATYPSALDVVAKQPRLAALFHYRLRQAGVDWPDVEALAATARRVWGSNQMRMFRAVEVDRALEEAGVEALFLKGLAVLHLYPAATTRPMQDIDLLVRRSDFATAMTALSELGWSTTSDNSDKARTHDFAADPLTLRYAHAAALSNGSGEELDLHWRMAPGSFADNPDTDPWHSSHTAPLAGRSIKVLGPTYQLYHTMSHGLAWDKDPSLHWIPDAAFVIQSQGDAIDWERLLSLADTNQRGVAVREGLCLLSAGLGVAVPDSALTPATAPRGPERREAWCLRHIGPKSPLGGIPDRWYLYRRVASSIGETPTPWGYMRYLRWRWVPHGSLFSTVKTKIVDRIDAARGRL